MNNEFGKEPVSESLSDNFPVAFRELGASAQQTAEPIFLVNDFAEESKAAVHRPPQVR